MPGLDQIARGGRACLGLAVRGVLLGLAGLALVLGGSLVPLGLRWLLQ